MPVPRPDFIPHPRGQFEGHIDSVEDRGEVDGQWGPKPKISVRVVNDGGAGMMETGEPYCVAWMMTLSSGTRATLRKLRENLLGRQLTQEECDNFDTDELVGRKVGYVVTHNQSGENTYANIDSCWPLKNGVSTATASQAAATAPAAAGNGERPDDMELDYLRRLFDAAETHGLMTLDQAASVRAQLPGASAAQVQNWTERTVAMLKERGVEVPPETASVPEDPFGDDQGLPFD